MALDASIPTCYPPAMAPPRQHDWNAIFVDFCKSGLTQKQYGLINRLAEANISREFKKIRQQMADEALERTRLLLASAAPDAANRAKSALASENEDLAVKAAFGILDRVGLSPQAAQSVNVAVQVNIPPFFQSMDNAPELKSLLQGERENESNEN